MSFEPAKVRGAYIRLKAKSGEKKILVGDKTLEYFLFVFKSLQMWPEIVDLCENFETLTGGSDSTEIKSYYLSDTLLQIPSSTHYYELVKKAVFDDKEPSNAGYVTAMTKAHFKDGSIDHALRFFEKEVQKLKEVKSKKEDLLVALFDSVYNTKHESMTYE